MMKPLTALVAAALVGAAAAWQASALGVAPPSAVAGTELITHCLPTEGQPTQLVVIDPANRSVAVYHVTRDSGAIQLKSVRNIRGDLLVEDFNGVAPLPAEINNMIRRAR